MNSKRHTLSGSEFTDLLNPHYNDAVNYCRALCSGSTKAEAEDVMQQALIKAFEHADALQDEEKFRSWFFQILTRCFYDSVRKPFWSRFASLDAEDGQTAFQIYEDDFFEDNQLLIGGLSKLSKKERTAILLFEIGGFSIREITTIQKENSESAIKSRLSRTRDKLKEFMEQADQEKRCNPRVLKSQRSLKTNDLYHETTKIINKIKSIG